MTADRLVLRVRDEACNTERFARPTSLSAGERDRASGNCCGTVTRRKASRLMQMSNLLRCMA